MPGAGKCETVKTRACLAHMFDVGDSMFRCDRRELGRNSKRAVILTDHTSGLWSEAINTF